eukprot:COSAG05_NODE_7618_length_789_cov_1.643478_1_plen_34_part_10
MQKRAAYLHHRCRPWNGNNGRIYGAVFILSMLLH